MKQLSQLTGRHSGEKKAHKNSYAVYTTAEAMTKKKQTQADGFQKIKRK